MQITLRIYRTHDYDLMALHRSGVLSFPKAARKALISYYKGETILISTEIDEKQVPEDLPAMLEFNITIGERTAPGFAEWFRTVKSGYRNNFVKNILRSSLDGFCAELYKPGARRPDAGSRDGIAPLSIPVKVKKQKKDLTGSEWVDAVAKEKPARNPEAKISDIDKLLNKNSANGPSDIVGMAVVNGVPEEQKLTNSEPTVPKHEEKPVHAIQEPKPVPIQNPESMQESIAAEEDDFDAFDSFNNLMKGV